MEEVVLKSG